MVAPTSSATRPVGSGVAIGMKSAYRPDFGNEAPKIASPWANGHMTAWKHGAAKRHVRRRASSPTFSAVATAAPTSMARPSSAAAAKASSPICVRHHATQAA